ncbi:hypothetical protein SODG_000738 [Sodalis praecaptivus]|uniref:hypothetical protein n=1 Tax=Sodalis praecaptivus TaxID=1239307 RepID=UPI0027FA2A2A|nr:hypothetical protein [Sodalis praecaptivus]CAJ0996308.1 hypothetical protein NVIRENTERO_02333 [Sodalis praecaptivus]
MESSQESALLLWLRMAASGKSLFERWHSQEHIPQRLTLPGVLSAERYVSACNARYFCRYRLSTPQALARQVEEKLRLEARKIVRPLASGGDSDRSHGLVVARLVLPTTQGDAPDLAAMLRQRFSPSANAVQLGWRLFGEHEDHEDRQRIVILDCADPRHGSRILAALRALIAPLPGIIALDVTAYTLQVSQGE